MAASIHTQAPNGAAKHQLMHSTNGARKLADLVELAKSFATDTDIETVASIVNQDLDLKACLQRKEEEVADLQHQMDSLKARFNDTHQDNLATYELSREKLSRELEDSRNEAKALKDRVGQDEHAIKALKESEAKLQYETERLQAASRTQRDKAKTDLTKIRELEGSLETARNDKVSLQTQLQHEENSHTRAKSGFANLQQRLDRVEKEYNILLQERQLAQSLSVPLTNDDPEQL